jgi:uncharacterized membrane protein
LKPTPGSNITRIYGVSDCVIAVAFTLFVGNIRLAPAGLNTAGLERFIAEDMLVDIAYYCGAYLVVASSWISHYRIVNYMQRSSSLFIMLNVVFLGSIVFLPVPIALIFRYHAQPGVWQVFAGTQAVTSCALLLLWMVARADHLLSRGTPAEYLRYTTARLVIISCGTLLSFALAFWNVLLAAIIFLLLFVIGWLVNMLTYRTRRGAGHLPGTIRMCSITDNMTAVAITFLIASVTDVVASSSHQSFGRTLGAIETVLPTYTITFLIVGFYWLSHHRLFMVIRQHDMALIWLNFGFLLFIELQPPFNALHSNYPDSPLASSLYAANQAVCGLMLLSIWIYAARGHRLIDQSMDRSSIRSIGWSTVAMPMLFVLSIAILFFRNEFAVPLWLLLIALEAGALLYRRLRPH